jgi:hypothetical protein
VKRPVVKKTIAEKLAFGLGGWFQSLLCQNLHGMAGEDAARVAALQILNAQNRYTPLTSRRPVDWPSQSKQRVDIALKGVGSKIWYGAIEMKWPRRVAIRKTRSEIVEDAARVAFVKTTNHRVNLLLLGATAEVIEKLFDKRHAERGLERQRMASCQLLPRLVGALGHLTNADLKTEFPSFGTRIPKTVFDNFSGRIKAELLASCPVKLGQSTKGYVFAWLCKRVRGAAK